MKPIDFVLFDGDSSPNDPVYKIAEAMKKPIKICYAGGDAEVLSYYFYKGRMILEIELIEEKIKGGLK